jgi:hypothetical protein
MIGDSLVKQVFVKMCGKADFAYRHALRSMVNIWRTAIAIGIGAGLLSIVSCSNLGDPQESRDIVYKYFASSEVAVAHMKHIGNFNGVEGRLVEEIYRKPPGTPGSRNFVRLIGGEDVTGNEVVDFSVLDSYEKVLFTARRYERWSTRSSRIRDYFYILPEPVPHQSAIAVRGDRWETVRGDTRAADYDYPYEIIEISNRTVERFECMFDMAALTSVGQRKVLAAVVGKNRPEDALDMIAKWLSEHGARNRADHCQQIG